MAHGLAASHLPKNCVDSTLRRVPRQNVVRAKNRAIPERDHRSVSRLENDSTPLDKLQRSSAIHKRVHRQAPAGAPVPASRDHVLRDLALPVREAAPRAFS